jgi:hypothetical protein
LVIDRRKQKVVRASVQGIDDRLLNRAVSHRRARIMADRLPQDLSRGPSDQFWFQ